MSIVSYSLLSLEDSLIVLKIGCIFSKETRPSDEGK
jgi:hypothetical protein